MTHSADFDIIEHRISMIPYVEAKCQATGLRAMAEVGKVKGLDPQSWSQKRNGVDITNMVTAWSEATERAKQKLTEKINKQSEEDNAKTDDGGLSF